jgi:hypothetical protein
VRYSKVQYSTSSGQPWLCRVTAERPVASVSQEQFMAVWRYIKMAEMQTLDQEWTAFRGYWSMQLLGR